MLARTRELGSAIAQLDDDDSATIVDQGLEAAALQLIADGQFAQASRRTAAHANELESTFEERRRMAEERVDAVRARLADLRQQDDVLPVLRRAPAIAQAAEQARTDGDAHLRAGEYRAASAAFAEATRVLNEAVADLGRQRRAVMEDVQSLLAQTDGMPPVVDLARAAGEAALRNLEALGLDDGMRALEQAQTDLRTALTEVDPYRRAQQVQGEAASLLAQIAPRAAPRALRRAERAMRDGADAWEQRRWRDAYDQYTQAKALLDAIANELADTEERARREKFNGVRQALQDLVGALEGARSAAAKLAVELDAAPARAQLDEIVSNAEKVVAQGNAAAALEQLDGCAEQVGAAVASARQQLSRAIGAAIEDFDTRRDAVKRSAGTLLGDQQFEAYGRQRAALLAAAEENRWEVAADLLPQCRSFLDEIATRARNEGAVALDGLRSEIDALAAVAKRMSDGDAEAAIDLPAIYAKLDASLPPDEIDVALQRARDAAAELTRNVADVRESGRQAAALGRAKLDELRASVDLEDAARVAPDSAAQATAAERLAEAALQEERYGEVVRAYESAWTAWNEAAHQLRVEQQGQRDQRTLEVTNLESSCVDGASEIVAEALHVARDALERAPNLPHAPAMGLLNAAKARLQSAIDELPRFNSAKAYREDVAATAQRVSSLRPAPRFRQRRAAQAATGIPWPVSSKIGRVPVPTR